MQKILKTINLKNSKGFTPQFDACIFENCTPSEITPSAAFLMNHTDVATRLKDKNPYTIVIYIDNLKVEYYNKKQYVQKTRYPRESLYKEKLFEAFNKEFGYPFQQYLGIGGLSKKANEKYGEWLEKYRPQWEAEGRVKEIDDYVVEKELEPRYKKIILKRYTNHQKLMVPRFGVSRERYYNLPEPFNRIDFRTVFDTIFIWEEDEKKVYTRGGSGSSGRRQIYSTYSLGLYLLQKQQPIPTYFFVYSEENTLLFVKKFENLCLPLVDIGANYSIPHEEQEQILRGGIFMGLDYTDLLSTNRTLHIFTEE